MFLKIPFSSIIVMGVAMLAAWPVVFGPLSVAFGGASGLMAGPIASDFVRIERELKSLTPELMRKHGVVGAQIHLFGQPQAGRDRSLAFGFQDADRTVPVQVETLFQASELVRPLTAYLLLDLIQSEARATGSNLDTAIQQLMPRLPDFPVRGAEEFTGQIKTVGSGSAGGFDPETSAPFSAYQLLTMTAGLPASRDGLIRAELKRPDADLFLRERLKLTHAPGDLIAIAPEGYAYAGKYLESVRGDGFETQLLRLLRDRFGIRDACVNRANCPEPTRVAHGTVHSGSYVFLQEPPHILYPSSDSLWISAGQYARFLSAAVRRPAGDPVAAALFEPVRRSDAELGGRAMGFQVLRAGPEGEPSLQQKAPGAIYVLEGRQPGFASYAFVAADGRGVVLLCNSNERFFIREMVSYLYDRFGLLEKSPPDPDAAALELARELEGSYRAQATVPAQESLFAFLTDVRIRAGAQRIDFGGVFQKEASVQLYPIAPDLYLARGRVTMDGWRVKVRRDADGSIVGLDSDLVRYDTVNPLISAWAILMYLGILTSAPVLLFMLFIIRRRSGNSSPGSTPA